ncbi:MAG: substrate-binding domain-containing protein [Oscillospiraceae bacterium]|jgi:ribose transport system substrate-binding protein|nr:substrate-binding domain-containing protein [Oscillospiraceae bacterium]
MTKRWVLVLMLLLFTAAFLVLFSNLFSEERPPRVYNVSMLIRGMTSDSWSSVRQGAEQAASEMNVELNFITLSAENAVEEQISLLWRELDDGASAIILSAADYDKLSAPVGRMLEKVPVVSLESPVRDQKVAAYVSADNYDMGLSLGNRVANDMGRYGFRVFVLTDGSNLENLRLRRQGLEDALTAGAGVEVVDVSVEDALDPSKWPTGSGSPDAVVALEPAALEAAAQYFADQGSGETKLYGMGNSGKIASFLDKGVIAAAVVQNDFGSGYLAVLSAVSALENREAELGPGVEYRIIDSSNMYDTENQRLLFPFVR